MKTARERKLDALQPIRSAVMDETIEGYFGVEFDDYGRIIGVNISLKDQGSLRIEPQKRGEPLEVWYRA